ncbi:MAG TPA: signal peptidase I [Verrucomicrobiae bacterium]|jgi:signal peptidase I
MIRWLFSKTVRDAGAMHKHVFRMLCAQRDLITPAAYQLVSGAIVDLRNAVHTRESIGKIREKMWTCEEVANKWLKPYPHPLWRENVEVLLVAIAVAMAIRTFFLQPFKIPTGSMQPTLYGVTAEPDYGPLWRSGGNPDQAKAIFKKIIQEQNDIVVPTGWARVKDWVHGISYVHYVAPVDGQVEIGPMLHFFIFNIKQTISIGGVQHTFWFPPDYGESQVKSPDGNLIDPFMYRAGLFSNRTFKKGEDVVKLRVITGDHLFVDRISYNFRKPARGDIVVFETKGIPQDQRDLYGIPDDEFYIKRLCGLGGETILLQQDYIATGTANFGDVPIGHLVVDGKPLSAATPHFENLYSFDNPTNGVKTIPYHEDGYFGHAMMQRLQSGQEVQIKPNHLFVMGDNTMDSLDSRYWGDFPDSSIVGKAFFVYWPLSSRFGWGNQ